MSRDDLSLGIRECAYGSSPTQGGGIGEFAKPLVGSEGLPLPVLLDRKRYSLHVEIPEFSVNKVEPPFWSIMSSASENDETAD